MTHRAARQRPRDPYRAAVLAPVHRVEPVRCTCGHARLMHGERSGQCLSVGCGCTGWQEADRGV